MSPLHVGYVLKMYPRLSETFIVNEILELERQGARVTVFSLRVPQEGRFHEKLARVRADVVYLPAPTVQESLELVAAHAPGLASVRDRLGATLWEILESGELRRLKLLAQAVALHAELSRRGVQHLHAHFATSSTEVAALASGLSGIPFSFTAHAKDIYLDAHDYARLSERIRRASFVVTVCDANRRHLEAFGGHGTPVHRIYNGLDLAEFRPQVRRSNGTPEILGVGRLVPKKGFDTLVRACRLLADRGRTFRCRIVGDGDERERLQDLVERMDLRDVVELAGALPNERVRTGMSQADLVVLPCRVAEDGNRDALPTVLLEAMALETPVVSTPVTGIPEIVGDDEAGVIVPPDDPERLAESVEVLLDDPDRRRRCGRAGRARAERLFDVRASVGELHDLFRRSAVGNATPTPQPRTLDTPLPTEVPLATRLP